MANRMRNARGHESRAMLLEAGLRSFHAHGYAATGVDVISKSAGVPKGSFYNHFGSKAAFGAEVVDLYFDNYLGTLRGSLGNQDLTPLNRLRAYFDERISMMRDAGCLGGCLLGNFSGEVADHDETIRHRLAGAFERWSSLFANCIRAAQEQGEIADSADAGQLADFLLNGWEGALVRMRAERSTAPLEVFRKVVFRAILVPRPGHDGTAKAGRRSRAGAVK